MYQHVQVKMLTTKMSLQIRVITHEFIYVNVIAKQINNAEAHKSLNNTRMNEFTLNHAL